MYNEKQLNYLKILKEQRNKGKISEKEYLKEVIFTKNLKRPKRKITIFGFNI